MSSLTNGWVDAANIDSGRDWVGNSYSPTRMFESVRAVSRGPNGQLTILSGMTQTNKIMSIITRTENVTAWLETGRLFPLTHIQCKIERAVAASFWTLRDGASNELQFVTQSD
jgi:hypothetical protein